MQVLFAIDPDLRLFIHVYFDDIEFIGVTIPP